jgi:uncharacterized protein YukE
MRSPLTIPFLALVSACSAPGTEGADRANAAGAAVTRFREETAKTEAAIARAIDGLDAITKAISTEPRPALDEFARAVDALDEQAERMRTATEDMEGRVHTYLEEWEKDAGGITNPDLRLRALDRRKELRDSMDKVRALLKEANPPLLEHRGQLRDVRTYLANDLTPRGLAVVKDVQAKARENGSKVRKVLVPVIEQTARLAQEISPAGN